MTNAIEHQQISQVVMQRFDRAMRTDSNYMGKDTEALMALFPVENYNTPLEWFNHVNKTLGCAQIPGGFHQFTRAKNIAHL